MKLRADLPPTPLRFDRGEGVDSIPFTGDVNKPLSAVWWTKGQILQSPALDYSVGKIFLGRVDQKMIGYKDNRHLVTIAGTRGGKSSCLLVPNLKLYPGSALVIDPKGELARETAAYRRDRFGHTVHVLDPWHVSGVAGDLLSNFDPVAELRERPDDLIDNADLIADALIIDSAQDPHWTDAAKALLRALVIWIVLDAEKSGGTLAMLPAIIARIAAESPKQFGGEASLLAALAAIDLDDVAEEEREAVALIRGQALVMLGPNDREIASILSSARTQLTFLESPAMARSLATSDLRLAHLKARPTTIYLCLPASRMGTHSRWLRLIVNLAVTALEDAGCPERSSQDDPLSVLFVLEEFAALGHLQALERAIAYLAGHGVKLWAVLQDISQLKRHYQDGWETFLGNAGLIQAFSVSDLSTCEYLSKRLGETTFQITNKVEVNADQAMKGDTGLRREFRTAPLLSPDELAIKFARKPDKKGGSAGGLALVLVAGARPFAVDRVHHGELVY